MVVIMKAGFTTDQLESAVKAMEAGGVKVMVSKGSETTILGAEGDASRIDQEKVSMLPGVDRVMRVSEPYKKANRKYHPDNTVIDLGNSATVGGDRLAVIAGPCSVESEEQIVGVAESVKRSGAAALRGGAFKPRTSPYAFQGMGNEGIRLLQEAKAATGLPIVLRRASALSSQRSSSSSPSRSSVSLRRMKRPSSQAGNICAGIFSTAFSQASTSASAATSAPAENRGCRFCTISQPLSSSACRACG